MPPVTKAEVVELALLARLELTEEEIARLQGELSAILAYAERLQAVDTDGVEPMTHAVPLDCPARPDEVGASFTTEEALADAPAREGDFFAVPRIIEVT